LSIGGWKEKWPTYIPGQWIGISVDKK